MATWKIIHVDPDASGSNDGTSPADAYTSLKSAFANEATDIVSLDEIHKYLCRSSNGTVDTSVTDISGYTTDETRYIIVESAQKHYGQWRDDIYILSGSNGSYEGTVNLHQHDLYITFSGLQISGAKVDRSWIVNFFGQYNGSYTGGSCTIDSCIIIHPSNGELVPIGVAFWGESFTGTVVNTLISGCINTYAAAIQGRFDSVDDTYIRVYNCTIDDCTNAFRGFGTQSLVKEEYIIKNLMLSNTEYFSYNNEVSDSNSIIDNLGLYNVTNDTGSHLDDVDTKIICTTNPYANSGIYYLKSDAEVVASGANLSTSGVSSQDIRGKDRGSSWDIGAFQSGTFERDVYIDPDVDTVYYNGESWDKAFSGVADAFNTLAGDITDLGSSEIITFNARSLSGTADIFEGTNIPLSSWTCDADHYVILSGVDQHNGIYNDSLYRIHVSSAATTNKIIFDADGYTNVHFRFKNVQFYDDLEGDVEIINFDCSSGGHFELEIDRCLFIHPKQYTNNVYTIQYRDSDNASSSTCRVTNNIFYNDGFCFYEFNNENCDEFLFANNTIYSATGYAIANNSSSADLKWYNNIIWGMDDPNNEFFQFGRGDRAYNAAESTNAQGNNGVDLSSITDPTDLFNDPYNYDLSPVDGALYIDSGTSLSTSGVTTDISGTSRPQGTAYDIGAYEYVEASPVTSKYSPQARIINIS